MPARRARVSALEAIRLEALDCTRCPLWQDTTQTVFGEGPVGARMVLVGEQPGDQEDRKGHPFVGPAGRVLDQALAAAGIERDSVYLTNAVKHFKHEQRGKRRLHARPNVTEIVACRPWLERELDVISPAVVVAMGAVAARSVLGPGVDVIHGREAEHLALDRYRAFVTHHPSAVLRAEDGPRRAEILEALVGDLRRAAAAV